MPAPPNCSARDQRPVPAFSSKLHSSPGHSSPSSAGPSAAASWAARLLTFARSISGSVHASLSVRPRLMKALDSRSGFLAYLSPALCQGWRA